MSEQPQQQPSNEPLRVDTDLMNLAIPKLKSLAGRLTSAGKQLQSTSESYGECWGGDKTGKKFVGQYQGPHAQVITAALQGGSVLDDSTEQVAAMVKAFESSEENAAATSKSLRTGQNSG
jgi:uncharacterized protein YukE